MSLIIERCTGPTPNQKDEWGQIPRDQQPVVSQDEQGVNCKYFVSDGTCIAMRELLPTIVLRVGDRLKAVRADYKSKFPTRREAANSNLRDITGRLEQAAQMADNPPTCRLLEERFVPSG